MYSRLFFFQKLLLSLLLFCLIGCGNKADLYSPQAADESVLQPTIPSEKNKKANKDSQLQQSPRALEMNDDLE